MTTVLLIDDQPVIGAAVRRMLLADPTIAFHFCPDPTQALATANRVNPTVILQDLVMPDVDGLTLTRFLRANPATRDTPLIVLSSKDEAVTKADAFAAGASDYLVKLPDPVELLARVRYHSRGYLHLLERNAATAELARSRKLLAEEMAAGERYVRSLMPSPQSEPVGLDWRYVPCTSLGGDAVGYHRLGPDHLALYLLDVTGHGLGSALLSVTVVNTIRGGTLPGTDFRHPGQVLFGLNEAFPCERHGEKFFTIWYGVYELSTRTLRWSGGGHPAGLLFAGDGPPEQLDSRGPMLGMMPWPEFAVGECAVPAGARLYLYSDGAHEIHKADGTDWTFPEFVATLAGLVRDHPAGVMDGLHRHIRELNGTDTLDDDLSILEVRFPPVEPGT